MQYHTFPDTDIQVSKICLGTMTGDQKCKSVEISPEFLKDVDAEMLQDMVLSAVNMALDESRALQEKMMGPISGGLPF